MQIKIKLWGQLKQVSGKSAIDLNMLNNSNLSDVVREIAKTEETIASFLINENGDTIKSTLAFVNNTQISWENGDVLEDGTTVTLMTPIAGG